MGEGFTAFSCGNETAKAGKFIDLGARSRTKVLLHAGRRPKRRPKDSASCRDQHCGRKTALLCASTMEKRSETQPGCRSCRRKPVADCNRSGNNDCEESGVPATERASSNPKGSVARADCESVLSFTAAEFVIQRVAQAKAGFTDVKRDRSHAGESGMRSAIDDGGSART